jgi:hypothetical protein
VWEIRTAKPLLLALFIDEMELRLPNQCHSNFLEIYTGELAIVPERKHCTSPSTQFYSEESTVFIRFYGRSTEDALLSRFRILFSTYVHCMQFYGIIFYRELEPTILI